MEFSIKGCVISLLVVCLMGGAIKYDFRNATVAKTQPTELIEREHTLKKQNHLAKVAINKLGESDSGNAKVEYNKPDKTLKFVLLDMDAEPEFKHSLLQKQTKRFKKITHITGVEPILIVSHRARIRKIIQLHEEAQQRKLNEKRANKIKAMQAQRNRKAEMRKLVKMAENKHNNKNNRQKHNQRKSTHNQRTNHAKHNKSQRKNK